MMAFSAEFHAINRESAMTAEMLSFGVTHIRKANHAKKGEYPLAFFNLSNGLERLCKLIFLADYAIDNHGTFPTNSILRNSLGHDLTALFKKADEIGKRRFNGDGFSVRPNNKIHESIYLCLHRFANNAGRYYNLDALTASSNRHSVEPIEDWYENVGNLILKAHYKNEKRNRVREEAEFLGELMGDNVSVLHFAEDGTEITDLKLLYQHAGRTAIVQKWGQFYVLQIIRWLSDVFSKLCHIAAYEKRIEPFLEKGSYFRVFYNEDSYLKSRKTWPIL